MRTIGKRRRCCDETDAESFGSRRMRFLTRIMPEREREELEKSKYARTSVRDLEETSTNRESKNEKYSRK